MKHVFSALVSVSLIVGSLQAAAGSSANATALTLLMPCSEPLPFDANLSDIALLMRPQQYVSDIATLAHATKLVREIENARVKDKLCMPPIHIACMVAHPFVATCFFSCSSNLGHFFGKCVSAKEPLAADVGAALINLFHKCEATYDVAPEDEKKDWLLKCAGNMPACLAACYRDPLVRAKVEDTFVQSVCAAEGKHDVYTSLTFDDLSKDIRFLQLLAEQNVNVKAVVAINYDYNYFVFPLAQGNEGSSVELALHESLHEKFNYPQRHHGAYHEDASELLTTKYKDLPMPLKQMFASLEATKSAFGQTLQLYLLTRTIDQFKARVLQLHPELEHMYMYAGRHKYIADCALDSSLRADILVGHDAVDIRSNCCIDRCCIDRYWQQAWQNFQKVRANCLSPSAIACSLRSITNKHAYMQLHRAATDETEQWDYIDGVWTQLSPSAETSHEGASK